MKKATVDDLSPVNSRKHANLPALFAAVTVPWSETITKSKTTSFPGLPRQRLNNLQWAALLTSLVQYDKILSKFGQQQLVMVSYACGFKQSVTGKYFEEIIILFIRAVFI